MRLAEGMASVVADAPQLSREDVLEMLTTLVRVARADMLAEVLGVAGRVHAAEYEQARKAT